MNAAPPAEADAPTGVPADVDRLLRTRLELDPRLVPPTRTLGLLTWTVPFTDDRGLWREFEEAPSDGAFLPILNINFQPGAVKFGLTRKSVEVPRGYHPYATVPDMASLLMAQGARPGDNGFVIPTFKWSPANRIEFGLDVPLATESRQESWGIVGRVSFAF